MQGSRQSFVVDYRAGRVSCVCACGFATAPALLFCGQKCSANLEVGVDDTLFEWEAPSDRPNEQVWRTLFLAFQEASHCVEWVLPDQPGSVLCLILKLALEDGLGFEVTGTLTQPTQNYEIQCELTLHKAPGLNLIADLERIARQADLERIPEGAEIAALIEQIRNNAVESVSLYGRTINDREAVALFHSLRTNTSVRSVDLGHSTGIGEIGTQALLEMLPYRGIYGGSLHLNLYESSLDTWEVWRPDAKARQLLAVLDLDIVILFLCHRLGPGNLYAEF